MRSIYSAVGLGALWIAAVGLVSPAAAQIPASGSEAWILPRMPDGRPDLQGNWTNATLTPFQRRRGQGSVLTREEVATLEGRPSPSRPTGQICGAVSPVSSRTISSYLLIRDAIATDVGYAWPKAAGVAAPDRWASSRNDGTMTVALQVRVGVSFVSEPERVGNARIHSRS